MDELLQQGTRKTIYEKVRTHPGISARELQRSLHLGWGETAYHLRQLTEGGALRRERGGHRDYYFTPEVVWGDRLRRRSSVRRAERTMLLALFEKPDMTFLELATRVRLSNSTVSFHLRHMLDLGIVERMLRDDLHRYHLKDPSRLAELLKLYQESFEDALVDRFVGAWSGLLRE
ncbi:MAG: winged helix-turn-helix transcriptional regulator [Candidatus Thermoplasmatota archaeon]|nr:winged helix-turn-helix transcriptional regulator [Candidatus Thermoplasmatota archaeon]